MTKAHYEINPQEIAASYKNRGVEPLADVMRNAIMANGIESVAFNNALKVGLQNNFTHEIKSGKVTSQEKSGRCWVFAGLNLFRYKVREALNLEDFEFSQTYPMFFDKLEKANYFLESVLRTLDEEVYSRIVMHIMADPLQDGGQWDMFVSLVNKYGAVPKAIMPETYHSANSAVMNKVLTTRLRQCAAELRNLAEKGQSKDELRSKKQDFLQEIYRLLTYFLGVPPEKFNYEFKTKESRQVTLENLDPLTFFKNYVDVNLDNYVSLIHAPTPDKPFGKTYTVDFLGNIVEGKPILYLNTDLGELKKAAIRQIQADEPVWFGCDVGPQSDKKKGLMDANAYLFAHSLDTELSLSKAERLLYGDSLLTHAMVFTGVHLEKGIPKRWKVENSWGEERGEKGFFIMSDNWFDEYNYQVVIHRNYLTKEMTKQLAHKPVVLPPWDPMGSLASVQ